MVSTQAWRWAVPAAVGVAIGGGVGINALAADASPTLPPRTAAQLLADVQNAKVTGLSGTVVENADLGLPALPSVGGGRGSAELASLVSGSHTIRVWWAGPEKVRLALLGTLGETDVIRSGRDVWQWESKSNTATHVTLPADVSGTGRTHDAGAPPGNAGAGLPTGAALTPQQAAERALAAVEPTTEVTTDGAAVVAGRPAYELVLRPRGGESLVGSVRLAVDGQTRVPLRVQVYPATGEKPAFEVGFTHVSFKVPGAEQFQFSPPPGAKVKESAPPAGPRAEHGKPRGTAGDAAPRSVGTGWTRVVVVPDVTLPDSPVSGTPQADLAAIVRGLPEVSGTWGSGRLLRSKVLSVLLTDDGRLVAGAVAPERLYAVAGQR